jgi:hypothetical protein
LPAGTKPPNQPSNGPPAHGVPTTHGGYWTRAPHGAWQWMYGPYVPADDYYYSVYGDKLLDPKTFPYADSGDPPPPDVVPPQLSQTQWAPWGSYTDVSGSGAPSQPAPQAPTEHQPITVDTGSLFDQETTMLTVLNDNVNNYTALRTYAEDTKSWIFAYTSPSKMPTASPIPGENGVTYT